MSEKVNLDVDTTVAKQKLDEVENKRQQVETATNKTVQEVEEKTTYAYQKVLSMARSSYLAGAAFVRATGTSVSYFFTSLISAGISAISLLTPILTAEAVTPGMQIQAAIGFLNIGIATTALIAAQLEQSKIAQQLASANEGLHNIQTIISYIPSLW
ncbi:MAG: hypothetical protein ACFFCE_05690 [Promethearchaeota archaeon]